MLQFDFSTFPTFETERLILRQLNEHDVAALHRLRSHEQTMKYICRPLSTCEQDAREFLDQLKDAQTNGMGITWCLSTRAAPTILIGIIGLYRINKGNFRGEVGYTLQPDYWGQGFMSEALQGVLKFSFANLGFHSLEAHADPRNERSTTLLKRNCFRLAGTLRDCIFFEGSFYSSAVYELLNSEWKLQQSL